ncbi:hypothetical protein H2O64_23250 [Kordia sp. YSTF-M3]|uniref:Uncharacterized protein n=1 Tax=Kordia aestuariivivens TaxID=2759037 RepID=A0ABR7QG98_9FLAO|nr:hypothetical protein [Kordia aestuariivivens]MBC8757604.1 hypothetical protein [Kordia aestuariivivens]
MKSLKLRKVKISKIGNPHILFGGATNGCPTTTPPPISVDEECIKSLRNECDTVTNTLPTQRTSAIGGDNTDSGD